MQYFSKAKVKKKMHKGDIKVKGLVLNVNSCLRFLQQPITMLPSSQECEACVLLCTFVVFFVIVV
jgi:hypothetical protein